jgi:hypothetical protein
MFSIEVWLLWSHYFFDEFARLERYKKLFKSKSGTPLPEPEAQDNSGLFVLNMPEPGCSGKQLKKNLIFLIEFQRPKPSVTNSKSTVSNSLQQKPG